MSSPSEPWSGSLAAALRNEASAGQASGYITGVSELAGLTAPVLGLRAEFRPEYYCDSLFPLLGLDFPAHLANAVPKRRGQYLAGRFLARQALGRATGSCSPVATGAHRAPVWPAGARGSISHTNDHAVCMIGVGTSLRIGVDVENVLGADAARDIAATVVGPGERTLLQDAHEQFGEALTMAFSGKETLFKALYPEVGRYFDFDAARLLELDLAGGTLLFELTEALAPTLPRGLRLRVQVRCEGPRVLTWLAEPVA